MINKGNTETMAAIHQIHFLLKPSSSFFILVAPLVHATLFTASKY